MNVDELDHIIEVKPYTTREPAYWSVTWEDTPKGWAVAVVNNRFFFPGTLTISGPDPSHADRKVDFQMQTTSKGWYVCCPSMEKALDYCVRQAYKAVAGLEGK